MGDLLKPRVISKEQALQKRDAEIAEAHARYERRIKMLDAQEAELARRFEHGEVQLPIRARNSLRYLMATYKTNRFGRQEIDHWPAYDEITPEAASKFTASQILELPNAGHKTVNDIAAWLRFHGHELKP